MMRIGLFIVILALAAPAWAKNPPPTATVPNVTSTRELPNPGGGLFRPGSRPEPIHFPNLAKLFSGGDVVGDAFRFVLDLLATVSGLVAFFYLIYGGVKFITAAGRPEAAEEGKKTVAGAIVGVVVISLAYVVILFIRNFLVSL